MAYSLSYRAVDKQRNTIDFLLTAKRDKKAARRFLNKAIGSNGKPSLINIDKSVANTAAIKQYNADENKRVKIRQCKYLNNIVEQDHGFIKRQIRPMLGFKSFRSARATLAGIELWRMLKKGQNKSSLPAWEQFYALGAQDSCPWGILFVELFQGSRQNQFTWRYHQDV